MKIVKDHIGIILLSIMLLGACNNTNKTETSNEESVVEEQQNNEEQAFGDNKEQADSNDEYPMPILDGWEEIEISFETIGGGKIDVWHGEFSYEGAIEDYFDTYQTALTDAGFEVTVTQDADGMKSLDIEKVIAGDNHVGNVLFTDHWVKSSLQHFK